jgi:hypothetical protein
LKFGSFLYQKKEILVKIQKLDIKLKLKFINLTKKLRKTGFYEEEMIKTEVNGMLKERII